MRRLVSYRTKVLFERMESFGGGNYAAGAGSSDLDSSG